MTTLTYGNFSLFPATELNFRVVSAGSSVISLYDDLSGTTENYYGSFIYSGSAVVGGRVDTVEDVRAGQLIWSFTGLNASAVSVYNAVMADDAAAILNIVLGGNDMIWGSVLGEPIIGHTGNDTVIALDGNDTISGGAGNDDVNGNVGEDLVRGDEGSDWVRGGKGNDTIFGDAGDDPHVNGNIGNDLVFGGTGNDFVYGGQDNDTLHGDAGADTLSGDLGSDTLFGDAGADRFTIRAGSGTDWAADFNAAEGDRIQLAPGTAYSVTSISGQVAIDLGHGDVLGLTGVAAGSFNSGWIVFA